MIRFCRVNRCSKCYLVSFGSFSWCGICNSICISEKKWLKAALDLNDSYPWLGIYAQSLTDDLIVSLNERNFKGSKGVIVTAIHPKSAALKMALKGRRYSVV